MPKVYNKYHGNAPADAVNIMRPGPYGNDYIVGVDGERGDCVALFVKHQLPKMDVSELRGRDLVCCCKPKECHGDYILEKANRPIRRRLAQHRNRGR